MRLNLQQFGGRGSGSGKGGGDLLGKQGNTGPISDVRDMISEREKRMTETDDVLSVGRRMTGLYGGESAVNQFQLAKVGGGTMAYYDADGNLAMNEKYMNAEGMNRAYDAAVKNGFHPSRGNMSGIQAVAAHEYGHALTDLAAQRMGLGGFGGIEEASRQIVERARKKTRQKTNMNFAGKISGYAQYNFAECVAEAVSDWYCNGSRANKESRAVMAVLNNVLRNSRTTR